MIFRNPVLDEWGDQITFLFFQKTRKFPKKPKKVDFWPKSQKHENLVNFTFAIFAKKHEKTLPNSPPREVFLQKRARPTDRFLAVLVLVVGGVQSGGKKKILFFGAILTIFGPRGTILGVDIIPGGGGGGG
jgi:hypothetical protein